jgi:hypothetical protein
VAEAQNFRDQQQNFRDQQVDGFGGSVADATGAKVGEEVLTPGGDGAGQPAEFDTPESMHITVQSYNRLAAWSASRQVVGPDLAPDLFGKGGECQQLGAAASRCSATLGSLSASASSTRAYWTTTDSASGWSKMECTRVRTQGQEDFGVTDIRLAA